MIPKWGGGGGKGGVLTGNLVFSGLAPALSMGTPCPPTQEQKSVLPSPPPRQSGERQGQVATLDLRECGFFISFYFYLLRLRMKRKIYGCEVYISLHRNSIYMISFNSQHHPAWRSYSLYRQDMRLGEGKH